MTLDPTWYKVALERFDDIFNSGRYTSSLILLCTLSSGILVILYLCLNKPKSREVKSNVSTQKTKSSKKKNQDNKVIKKPKAVQDKVNEKPVAQDEKPSAAKQTAQKAGVTKTTAAPKSAANKKSNIQVTEEPKPVEEWVTVPSKKDKKKKGVENVQTIQESTSTKKAATQLIEEDEWIPVENKKSSPKRVTQQQNSVNENVKQSNEKFADLLALSKAASQPKKLMSPEEAIAYVKQLEENKIRREVEENLKKTSASNDVKAKTTTSSVQQKGKTVAPPEQTTSKKEVTKKSAATKTIGKDSNKKVEDTNKTTTPAVTSKPKAMSIEEAMKYANMLQINSAKGNLSQVNAAPQSSKIAEPVVEKANVAPKKGGKKQVVVAAPPTVNDKAGIDKKSNSMSIEEAIKFANNLAKNPNAARNTTSVSANTKAPITGKQAMSEAQALAFAKSIADGKPLPVTQQANKSPVVFPVASPAVPSKTLQQQQQTPFHLQPPGSIAPPQPSPFAVSSGAVAANNIKKTMTYEEAMAFVNQLTTANGATSPAKGPASPIATPAAAAQPSAVASPVNKAVGSGRRKPNNSINNAPAVPTPSNNKQGATNNVTSNQSAPNNNTAANQSSADWTAVQKGGKKKTRSKKE